MKNLFLIFFTFLLLNSLPAFSQNGKFSFTISSPVATSAGVFVNDSILVRTLWSNVNYAPGTYTKEWDGKDDFGVKLSSPASSYKVKIMSNNVKYEWQGTIGNTSTFQTGATKHRGYNNGIKGLAFSGNYGYFCTGYSEAGASFAKFNTSTPNERINITVALNKLTNDVDIVCTDGTKVYWSGLDASSPNNSYVFGTNVSDDAFATFPSGVSYTSVYGLKLTSLIGYSNLTNSSITGLGVQKTGNYLFVARSGLNELKVLNKTTGALVQTFYYSAVRGICVDGSDNLWMITGTNTVAKYTVNADGSLTAATLTLSGLVDPLTVNYGNSLVAVCDGSTSQQVKFFNSSTGATTAVLGDAGGYQTDASVTNSKFYFDDLRSNKPCFVAWQPDNSFWVNDFGNSRVQHYNSNHSFLDRIMFMGATYSSYVDKGNINKVFADFLEFSIDYNVQTLSGTAGWSLTKNWGANVTTAYDDFGKIRYQTTFRNGRTYGFIRKGFYYELVEYVPGGTLRFTGVMRNLGEIIGYDGSISKAPLTGLTYTYMRYANTGFDASNNPIWSGTAEILGTATDNSTTGSPASFSFDYSTLPKLALYHPESYANQAGPVYSTGYHLGLMQKGANNAYLFKTEKSTSTNYSGAYPPAGWFECGNRVNNSAGSDVMMVDSNIVTGYHGEFWKNGQTNKFNHYYLNGLALGQFGTTRDDSPGKSAPGMAGNAITPVMVKQGNDMYVYHGDESDHSAIHRWKISGLNTISIQEATIGYPSGYVLPAANYTDLMAGLPFNAVLATNTAGWTRNPWYEDLSNPTVKFWTVATTRQSYDTLTSNDITIGFFNSTATTNTVERDLGANNVTTNWKIQGNISFPATDVNINNTVQQQFIEVLDANGKVLTTFYVNGNYQAPTNIYANKIIMASGMNGVIETDIRLLLPFEVSLAEGSATFTYGNYKPVTTTILDAAGNWRTPKTLRFRFTNTGIIGPGYTKEISIQDFKFYKDYSATAPDNKVPVANAGSDQIITLPTSSTVLSGSGTDPDGTINNYSWLKISGPASGTIASATTNNTQVNSLAEGTYQFELTVTDNNGAIAKDIIQVIVNGTTSGNLLPAVNPGNTENGLNYKYYEGNWYVLPNFSALSPIKTGNSNNFDLSLANRPDQYGFSFTGYINVPADGQYTFYTTSDDGSSLYIDNVLTVSNDGLHGADEKSGTIGLKAGKHAITGLFFQQGGGQVFTVSYAGMGINKQAIPSSALFRVSSSLAVVNPENGLDYKYYEGNWTMLPNFSTLNPIKTGTTSNFDLSLANRPDQYGFSFTGYINIPADGQYTFYTTSDDGSSLYIDNVLTVSNDGLHGAEEKSGTIPLKAGMHAINGLFFQQGGGQVFTVSYAGVGITKQKIPSSVLFRTSNSTVTSNLFPAVYPSNAVNGLDYKYYEGSWAVLPNFSALYPIKTGTSSNFELSYANRPDQYGFSFTGYVNVPADGQYTFYTTSDDGSNLYIDNVLVVANDGLHGAEEKSGTIGLKAGKHAITGLFFQQGGGQVFGVSYSSAAVGLAKQAIPASALYRVNISGRTANAASPQTSPNLGNAVNPMFASANGISVFPNPVRDFANLEINAKDKNDHLSVSVYNSVGVLVKNTQLSTNQATTLHKLNLSGLPNGYYSIVVRFNNGQQISSRIVKVK